MNLVFEAPNLAAFVSAGNAGKPIYRKELVYAGTFKDSEENVHDITEKHLQHWVASFSKMKEAGVKVPVPAKHTDDPDKRRGTLIALELGQRDDGTPNLFGYIEFNDAETAKQGINNDVSIYVPEELKANGVEEPLQFVIAHVALTDYPVVNDLGDFEAIAASFACPKDRKKPMLKELAKKLGIEFEEDSSDDVVADRVAASFSTLKAAIEDLKKNQKEPEGSDDPEKKKEEEKKEMAASFAKKFAKIEKPSRELRIDNLVSVGKITKAVADDLKKTFCTEDTLSLAFSMDEDKFKDSFDSTFAALEKNEPVLSFSSRTGPQADADDFENNPLLKDAESRSKAN